MRWLGRVKSWALRGHSSWSSWRGGLCERTGPSLYGVAGLSRRNFSKRKSEKKRHSVAIWGILQQQPLQPPPHPASKVVKKASSSHPRPWGECTTRRALTPAWTGFYCFSRHITSRMVFIYYTQVCFGWLQKTTERMLLITSKKKDICKCKVKSS